MTTELRRAEIKLLEIAVEARGLFGFAIATSHECGIERPACVSLQRMVTLELLKLSVAHGAAEERVARRVR